MKPNVDPVALKAVLAPAAYEAPCVEVALDAESLAREVHYAGVISIDKQ